MAEVATAFVSLLPSMRGFGPAAERGMGGTFSKIGRLAGPLLGTAAVVGFAKKAVGLEAEFSGVMNQMGAVANVPKNQLKDMSKLAIQMGRDTVFSAKDAADAMLELAKNGITPAQIKAGALKSALTLAAAGGVSMEEAATTMGNSLNAFNLKASESASVAAALAGAANASSASIGSLSQGLAQSAASAAASGLSIQETTAALAGFANAGIQGSDAGTSLKTFLTRLVPQTKKAQEALVGYGLASYNAHQAQQLLAKGGIKASLASLADEEKGSLAIQKMLVEQGDLDKSRVGKSVGQNAAQNVMWQTGIMDSAFTDQKGNFESLSKISGALSAKLGKLNQSERTTALTTLFGSDAQRAGNVLMNLGAKGVDKLVKATSDNNAAQRVAKSRMKGTAGALEQFRGSLETVTLQAGQLAAPVAQKGLGLLTQGLNKVGGATALVSKAFAKTPPLPKHLTGKQGDVLSSRVDGGPMAAKLAPIQNMLTTKLVPAFAKTAAAVKQFAAALLPTLKEIGGKIMTTVGPALGQIADLVVTQLLPAFRRVLPILLPVAKFLLGMLGDAVIGVIKGGVQAIKGAINIIAGVLNLVVALVHGDWSGAWKALVQIAKGAFNLVVGAIRVWFNIGILAIFKHGVLRLLGSWRGLWSGAKGLATKGLGLIRGAAERGLSGLGGLFTGGLKLVGRLIWTGLKAYLGLWRRYFNLVWSVVKLGWRQLRGAFSAAFAILRAALGAFVARTIGFWKFVFRNVLRVIREGLGKAVTFFKNLPGRIVNGLGNLRDMLVRKGMSIVSGLMDGIASMGRKLGKFVKKFVIDHIPGPIAHALGIQSPSRVMAAQAKFIPLGMVKGIDDASHHVDRAMTRLSSRVQVTPPSLDSSLTTGASSGAARGQQIRGTLGIDRDGVAYIHGVSRHEVHQSQAARLASDRAAAMSE